MSNELHQTKIHNIITHFIKPYDDEEALNKNNELIAKVFISVTTKEKLFDEQRKILEQFPLPEDNSTQLQHAINELCEKRDIDSIHNFLEKSANLDSSKYRIEIPYDDITFFIYGYPNEIFMEAVEERLDIFLSYLKQDVSNLPAHEAIKVEKVYKKFSRHIKLAISQRSFFLAHAKRAERSADQALQIANEAKQMLDTAQITAKGAADLAKKAQKLANEADAQAKSTIANYIAILGIFASIIFTLFGGVNLISATVKLLEANSRGPYLTFVIALLMICLMTLLNMMVKWITSINNLKSELEKRKTPTAVNKSASHIAISLWPALRNLDFYTKSIICFSIILGLSLIGMYKVSEDDVFSFSREKTTRNISNPDVKKEKDELSQLSNKESKNAEMTLVEKYTVTNKSSDALPEKEEKN